MHVGLGVSLMALMGGSADPTLAADIGLLTDALPAGLTFSRASAATDVINGVLTSFASGAPRISVANGYLPENQATNLAYPNGDYAWKGTKTTGQADPAGATEAYLLTCDTNTDWHGYGMASVLVTGASYYTVSAFVKAGTSNFIQLNATYNMVANSTSYINVDLTDGVITRTGATALGAFITPLLNGWYRIGFSFLTQTTPSSSPMADLVFLQTGTSVQRPSFTSVGTETFFLYGIQLEVGSKATSYIPTTTAAATRAADVCYGSVPGLTTGMVVIEAKSPLVFDSAAWNVLFDINNGASDTNKLFGGAYNGTADIQSVVGGSAVYTGTCGVWPAGTVQKLGCAFGPNDFVTCKNGTLSAPDTTGSVASGLTNINIGYERWGGRYWNGYVRSIKVYNKRKTNAELQALAA